MAPRDQKQPTTPPLFIELYGPDGPISVPATSIYEIYLKQNCAPDKENHSRVVVVRLHPDNTRSSVIATWWSDKNPYHFIAAKEYYERLTALINVIKLNQWNRDPNSPPPDSTF